MKEISGRMATVTVAMVAVGCYANSIGGAPLPPRAYVERLCRIAMGSGESAFDDTCIRAYV